MHQPEQPALSQSLRTTGPSALATDAKSMHDAVKKDTAIQGATCKHTAVELMVFKQILRHTGSVLRWVPSERQIATKVSARHLFAEGIVRQPCRLVWDHSYIAAKK